MSNDYTYILTGIPSYAPMGNPHYGTRHEAVGEKAILEAIHDTTIELRVRERWATDPV